MNIGQVKSNMDKRIKEAAAAWLPEDIHAIPLRVWKPDGNQVVPYQGAAGVPGGFVDFQLHKR